MPRQNAYVFTLNNWQPADRLRLEAPHPAVRYIIFGEEIAPTTGTPHLQGYLQLWKEMKMKDLNPLLFDNRARLALARGSEQDNQGYCSKDAQNVYERGVPRKGKGERSDLSAVQAAINEGRSYDEICDDHFDTVAKYDRFVRQRVDAHQQAVIFSSIQEELSSVVLRRWQQTLLDRLLLAPDPRKVMWRWERVGNIGKSFFAKYLTVLHGALKLEPGKKMDLAYIFAQKPSKIVIFDLARTTAPDPDSQKTPLDVIYSLMESLKNGYLISTKYDSRAVVFEVPHVLVFANFPPDTSKMSNDRWDIEEL